MPYYHVVFTLPAPIGDIAYHNKAVIYDILFKAAAETLITIAAGPEAPRRPHRPHRRAPHLGGSALTHHPHVHIIVPGGGIALDGQRWIACRPGFFLPVRILSRLFRRLFLERLVAAYDTGQLQFFGTIQIRNSVGAARENRTSEKALIEAAAPDDNNSLQVWISLQDDC